MNHKYHKYLNKKSAHKKWGVQRMPRKEIFDFIITIPCYDEYDYLFKTLESLNKQDQSLLSNTLVSIVINNSDSESQKIIDTNHRTFEKLIASRYSYEMIVTDAFSTDNALIEKDAGVGMARKISVDITLPWSHANSIICFIDADVELSKDYLSNIHSSYKKNKWEAATINFKHQRDEPKTIEFINQYEEFLKKTATNLKISNSPYNYVPLGSTMICTRNGYISAGGMNRRKAAEDFYFLQELQKTVGVFYINDTLIYPSSRFLNRSYLGTSTRLKQCLDGDLNIDSLNYSSRSFQILSKWISTALGGQKKSYALMLEECHKIDPGLSQILINQNFEKAWEGIISAPSYKHFEKQFHRWFDAFKTLKLLKYYS